MTEVERLQQRVESLERELELTKQSLEENLRHTRHRLELDVPQLKRVEAELEAARHAAELANRAKDEFLANVSHEIRTPMNAILGMTELALDAAETADQKQLLSTVKVAARSLLHVINDLLDFSRISAGKLVLDHADFSLRAAIADTVHALAVRAHRKGLELSSHVHHDVPDLYFGDAGCVRQVLMNLIGNAIKFTARGEVVAEVQIDPDAAIGDDGLPLLFTVRDTGIGISADKHAAIFRAFEQEDASTTRRFGGTGLGLTISSQIAALMGGRITVESEPGRGSTFSFTARIRRSSKPESLGPPSPRPLDGSEELGGGEASAVPGGVRPLHVLIAEDNEVNVALLRALLGQRGHSMEVAGDGRSALELASRSDRAYDVILLDLHMPEIDGFEVVQAIRERERELGTRLPVIALTARSSPRDRERALAAGMNDFLSKPIDADELWSAIERAISGAPPTTRLRSQLLDARAIVRMCGGRAAVLDRLCEVFRRSVPERMAAIQVALARQDFASLRVAAHVLAGTVSAFSSSTGALASMLEDAAVGEDLASCRTLVQRLDGMCAALLEDTRDLTLEALGF